MIITKYQSRDFDPKKVAKRYVKIHAFESYPRVFEVDAAGFTIREQLVSFDLIPDAVLAGARAVSGTAFSSVEWPL